MQTPRYRQRLIGSCEESSILQPWKFYNSLSQLVDWIEVLGISVQDFGVKTRYLVEATVEEFFGELQQLGVHFTSLQSGSSKLVVIIRKVF